MLPNANLQTQMFVMFGFEIIAVSNFIAVSIMELWGIMYTSTPVQSPTPN